MACIGQRLVVVLEFVDVQPEGRVWSTFWWHLSWLGPAGLSGCSSTPSAADRPGTMTK